LDSDRRFDFVETRMNRYKIDGIDGFPFLKAQLRNLIPLLLLFLRPDFDSAVSMGNGLSFCRKLKQIMAVHANILGRVDQKKLIVIKPPCWRTEDSRKCNWPLLLFESTKPRVLPFFRM
jgi:hypothetical protein